MSTHVIPLNRSVYIERTVHVIECASCCIDFGIGADFMARRREDHAGFYCPNGHPNYYSGPTKAEKEVKALREQLNASRSLTQRERERRRLAEAEAAERRADDVRLRWRVANGVCPCCHRRFSQLADHMGTKHPDFADYPITALSRRQIEILAQLAADAEEVESAFVDASAYDARSFRALVRRGLVEEHPTEWALALTETGWKLAPAAAQEVSES